MNSKDASVIPAALITGANRGIGKAIAQEFAAKSINLVLCVRTLNLEIKEFSKSLEVEFGILVFLIELDLCSMESIKRATKEVHGLGIKIGTLVNNAGIASGSQFQLTPDSELRAVFETNFFGTYFFSQGISKLLMRSDNPSIVNISSVSSLDPKIGTSAYGASKAALNYASQVMAQELIKFGIRVNVVAPGVTKTDMYAQISEKALPVMLEEIAIGRPAQVNEISKVVVFLASKDASYINGQIIRVDGGRL